MPLLRIAWKEIRQGFRDVRTFVFMFLFPLVLMLVLGTALTGAFTNDVAIDDMHVLYKNSNDQLTKPLDELKKQADKSDIHFQTLQKKQDGKQLVKQGKADGYVAISDTGVHLYVNDQDSIETSVLKGMLSTFVDRNNLASVIMKKAPDKIDSALAANQKQDYIKDQSVNKEKQPGSMDYYALVMTTMIALYAAMSASSLMTSERARHTADRLMIAPIKKWHIFTGKVLASVIINMICVVGVILFSKFVFHAYWSNHWGLILLMLVVEVILAVSFGLSLSFLIQSAAGPRALITIMLQLVSFFGGAYFPLGDTSGVLNVITHLSPLRWVNDAMFKLIYDNDLSSILPAIGLNAGLALLFMMIAIVSISRREGI